MAIPTTIDRILHDHIVESARIEYKENWNPTPILHTICAFANDIDNWGGGYIIIGIKEDHGQAVFPVSGVPTDSIDRILKELLNLCNFIEPRYIPLCELVLYEGKQLLIIWTPGGYSRPYKCPIDPFDKKGTKAYYIRKLSSTIKANAADVQNLHSLTNNIPFDDRVNLNSNLNDLKASLIADYLYEVKSDLQAASLSMPLQELARNLRIADGPSEYYKPLNVGLMFFNPKPELFFKYAQIEVAIIPDPTGSGMTEKTFRGPLNKQLSDALNFIRNSVVEEKIFKDRNVAEALRIYNYPYAALEELLCNAVYHKSYQLHEPITVRILPDKIEITSCPGPDRSISDDAIKNLKMVARRYRNRRIGDFLKELKLIEGRNTGIPAVLKALTDNESPSPIFETDSDRSFFTATLLIHPAFLSKKAASSIGPDKKRRTRHEIEAEINNNLGNQDYSTNELAGLLGYSGISKTLSEVVNDMISRGIIVYSKPDSVRSPVQKLRLVQK